MLGKVRNIKSGVMLSLCSTFFFSVMYLFTKLASKHIPTAEIAFFRGLIGVFLVVPYMLYKHVPLTSGNKKLLFMRGLLGGIAVLLSFYAVSRMKLSEVSILLQTTPIFVVVFARMFLKEKLPKSFYLLMCVSICGVLFVIKPSFDSIGSIPAMLALLSAMIASIAYVCIKSLRKTHSTHIVVLYFTVAALVVPVPLMWHDFVIPNLSDLGLLLVVGISATIAQFFMTKAYGVEKAGLVSMVNYTTVFFNMFWDIVVWSAILDIGSLIGGALIILSSVILTLRSYSSSQIVRGEEL
jgi:drug/metabolite transporter (DMT)-like permease